METDKNVGIIGAGGVMGGGIAANYLKAGYEVHVWNRTPEKLLKLAEQGGRICTSPNEAAKRARIVFEVTSNDESSSTVWLGENGILAGSHEESILIASSTLSLKWVEQLAGTCAQMGRTFFDISLTGGRAGAENGTLTLLAGGDPEELEALKADLAAISKEVLYFGPNGSGTRFKLILNTIKAAHLVAFREGLSLVDGNMNLETVGDALAKLVVDMTARSWQDRNKAGETNFRLDLAAKDVRYTNELTGDTPTPIFEATMREYNRQEQDGHGLEEWTKVVWNNG